MKYNYSTAILFFKQAEPPAKKTLYLGATAVLCVVAVLGYGLHLYRQAHPRVLVAASHAAPVAVVATAAPVVPAIKQSVAVVEKIPMPLPVEKLTPAPVAAPMAAPVTAPVVAPMVPPAVAKAVEPVVVPNLIIIGEKIRSSPVIPAAKNSPGGEPPPALTEEARLSQAAQLAFGNMMDMANQYPDTYGFKPGDALHDARLGDAIPIYMITHQDCTGYRIGQSIQPLLKPADRWVFPVFIGDQMRCVVQVSLDGHKYIPGSGSKILAMFWSKILEKWPAEAGYHPQLIINPDMPDYYFTVPELKTPNITDTSDVLSYGENLSPAAVILASWR